MHVGTQGFSPRTRSDAQLLRFGEDQGRIALRGTRESSAVAIELTLRSEQGKRATLNGASLRAAEQLRNEIATLVFTPDRLAVVKGGPAVRRAYFDRIIGRLFPARVSLAIEYAGAVAQRNAALRRIGAGLSSRDALDPWTTQVVELGRALVETRTEVIALLAAPFALYENFTPRYENLPTPDPAAAAAKSAISAGLSLSLTQAWLPQTVFTWQVPAWTLSVEAFFYAIFPFASLWVMRLSPRPLRLAAVVFYLLTVVGPVLKAILHPGDIGARLLIHNPLFRWPEFLLGMCLGKMFLDRRCRPAEAARCPNDL